MKSLSLLLVGLNSADRVTLPSNDDVFKSELPTDQNSEHTLYNLTWNYGLTTLDDDKRKLLIQGGSSGKEMVEHYFRIGEPIGKLTKTAYNGFSALEAFEEYKTLTPNHITGFMGLLSMALGLVQYSEPYHQVPYDILLLQYKQVWFARFALEFSPRVVTTLQRIIIAFCEFLSIKGDSEHSAYYNVDLPGLSALTPQAEQIIEDSKYLGLDQPNKEIELVVLGLVHAFNVFSREFEMMMQIIASGGTLPAMDKSLFETAPLYGLHFDNWPKEVTYFEGETTNHVLGALQKGWKYIKLEDGVVMQGEDGADITVYNVWDFIVRTYLMMFGKGTYFAECVRQAYYSDVPEGYMKIGFSILSRAAVKRACVFIGLLIDPVPLDPELSHVIQEFLTVVPTAEELTDPIRNAMQNKKFEMLLAHSVDFQSFIGYLITDDSELDRFAEFIEKNGMYFYSPFYKLNIADEDLQGIIDDLVIFEREVIIPQVEDVAFYNFAKNYVYKTGVLLGGDEKNAFIRLFAALIR